MRNIEKDGCNDVAVVVHCSLLVEMCVSRRIIIPTVCSLLLCIQILNLIYWLVSYIAMIRSTRLKKYIDV